MQNDTPSDPGSISPYFSPSSFWIPDWIPEISAWLEHGPFAFWLTEMLRPSCFVELGSHWGYSYMAFCQAVQTHRISTRCYAVDTWQGDEHAGFYGDEVFSRLGEYNQSKYGSFSTLIRSTFDQAVEHFADGSVDLLHIDGLHTYEAAKHDFESWRSKLSPHAVVLFHDTNVRERGFGIWRLWQELAADFPHFAFDHGHGLGVLGVGSELPPILRDFLLIPDGSNEANEIRSRYARLGGGVTKAKFVQANVDLEKDLQHLRGALKQLQGEKNDLLVENSRVLAQRLDLIKLQAKTLTQFQADREAEIKKLNFKISRKAEEQNRRDGLEKVRQQRIAHATENKQKALREQIRQLEKVVQSAVDWQKKSWFKRAFHHWRAPKIKKKKNVPLLEDKSPVAPIETTATASPVVKLPVSHAETVSRISSEKAPLALTQAQMDRNAVQFRALFNESFYLAQKPVLDGLPSLKHYETIGWRNGLDPHPMFDVSWYLENNPELLEKNLEPMMHYLNIGWSAGLSPHPFFDNSWYLATYADVARAGLIPLVHYLNRGWKEGRLPHPAGDGDWWTEFERTWGPTIPLFPAEPLAIEVALRLRVLNPDKKTILLVTHDSSRTGAPILVLNLIARFKATYNVIAFALRKGSLEKEFDETSDAFLAPYLRSDDSVGAASRSLQTMLDSCPIEFALVNSIESTAILPTLARNNVPVVQMVHEFAAYTRPRNTIQKAAFYTDATVFSARIVYENALQECPELIHRKMLVAPQGLCSTPISQQTEDHLAVERQRIEKTLRPQGWENAIVVLGMGTVQLRKGVDLFFSCAERVVRNNPGRQIRFVWIGHGFNPNSDLHFSVYLDDQLHRLGLGDSACMMEEISQLSAAYQLADFFFLSSRLDPLPVVSQEAMSYGLPVICFENAVGTADTLVKNPVTARCIVPYLNVEAAADTLQSMIDDPQLKKQVGDTCRKLVEQYFDMGHYVQFLENTALQSKEHKFQEIADCAIIKNSGLLDLDFLLSPSHPAISNNPFWWFTRSWASGITLRKPFPGFHPGVYAEKNGITDRDPTAHYIEAGEPDGSWRLEVIDGGATLEKIALQPKVALHLHLYFADMAMDLLGRLAKNDLPMDLFVSVASPEVALEVEELTKNYLGGTVEIRVVPNRGRDIGPFFTEFGRDIVDRYDFVGHIHTKRSLDLKSPAFTELWANFLYENLLGGKQPMAATIISHMSADPTIGLVFPDDPYVVGWGENFPIAAALATRLKMDETRIPKAINFPIGTMFWARTAAIKPWIDLNLQWEDYPVEPLPYDGSMLHSIERLFPLVAEKAGFRTVVTHVPGITR